MERLRGVYSIRNKINGKQYIGKSIDLKLRKYHHFNDLDKQKHHSSPLQNAYNKYGKDNFEFIVLIQDNSLTDEELNDLEIRMIIEKDSDRHKNGYNVSPGGGAVGPIIQSEESNKKRSLALKGRVFTKEHSERKSLAQVGSKNPSAKAVSIDGKKYETITEACKELNVKMSAMIYRLKTTESVRFKDWFYL